MMKMRTLRLESSHLHLPVLWNILMRPIVSHANGWHWMNYVRQVLFFLPSSRNVSNVLKKLIPTSVMRFGKWCPMSGWPLAPPPQGCINTLVCKNVCGKKSHAITSERQPLIIMFSWWLVTLGWVLTSNKYRWRCGRWCRLLCSYLPIYESSITSRSRSCSTIWFSKSTKINTAIWVLNWSK